MRCSHTSVYNPGKKSAKADALPDEPNAASRRDSVSLVPQHAGNVAAALPTVIKTDQVFTCCKQEGERSPTAGWGWLFLLLEASPKRR